MFNTIRSYFRGRKLKKVKEWRAKSLRDRAYRDNIIVEVEQENKDFVSGHCPVNNGKCSQDCNNFEAGHAKRYLVCCNYRSSVNYEKIRPSCKLWTKEVKINNYRRTTGIF